MFKKSKTVLFALVATLTVAPFAHANDATLTTLKSFMANHWEMRDDVKVVQAGIEILKQAPESSNQLYNYAVKLNLARAYYWVGAKIGEGQGDHISQAQRDEKVRHYELGAEFAKQAIAINGDYADAYYYRAINNMLLARTSNIIEFIKKHPLTVNQVESDLKAAMKKKTAKKTLGVELDEFGPLRMLAAYYNALRQNEKALNFAKSAEGKSAIPANQLIRKKIEVEMATDEAAKANLCSEVKSILSEASVEAAVQAAPKRAPETRYEVAYTCSEFEQYCGVGNKAGGYCNKF